MLAAQNIECVKGHDVLFSGFSFAIEPHQIVQVNGANGSGKTSLLRILIGLSEPESGEVTWNGESIFEQAEDYSQQLAYLGHLNALKSGLTALENLTGSQSLLQQASAITPIDALQKVGLEAYQDVYAYQLSAGQQRRTAMARLLLSSARLWILDEPISAIDANGVAVFEDMVVEHTQRGGMVVLTSHQALQFAGCDVAQIDIHSAVPST